MKFRTTIDLKPTDVDGFLMHLPFLGEKKITEFLIEYGTADADHEIIKLLKKLLQREEFTFLWKGSKAKKPLKLFWHKLIKHLEHGYHLGQESYVPYPYDIQQWFKEEERLPFNRHVLLTQCVGPLMKFETNCADLAAKEFADNQ